MEMQNHLYILLLQRQQTHGFLGCCGDPTVLIIPDHLPYCQCWEKVGMLEVPYSIFNGSDHRDIYGKGKLRKFSLLQVGTREGKAKNEQVQVVHTHSKCFLIFSGSAYFEMPFMKRVRFTWNRQEARNIWEWHQSHHPSGSQMLQRIGIKPKQLWWEMSYGGRQKDVLCHWHLPPVQLWEPFKPRH